MVRYQDNHFILISPIELKIPDYLRQEVLIDNKIPFKEVQKLEPVMPIPLLIPSILSIFSSYFYILLVI